MNKVFRKTAKGIVKAGYFSDIKYDPDHKQLSFKDVNGYLYSFQWVNNKPFGVFSIGRVIESKRFAPTYESGYNSLGWINTATYQIYDQNKTDNPAFIIRQAKAFVNPTI